MKALGLPKQQIPQRQKLVYQKLDLLIANTIIIEYRALSA